MLLHHVHSVSEDGEIEETGTLHIHRFILVLADTRYYPSKYWNTLNGV
jgi:hypothetical protein